MWKLLWGRSVERLVFFELSDCSPHLPLLLAFVYWVREGVVTGSKDGCRPYSVSKECGTPCLPDEYPLGEQKRQCVRQCQPTYYKNSYAEDKHFGILDSSAIIIITIYYT